MRLLYLASWILPWPLNDLDSQGQIIKKKMSAFFFAFLEDNVINVHTPTLYTPLHSTPPSFVIEIEIGPYTFKKKNRWAVCTHKAVLLF